MTKIAAAALLLAIAAPALADGPAPVLPNPYPLACQTLTCMAERARSEVCALEFARDELLDVLARACERQSPEEVAIAVAELSLVAERVGRLKAGYEQLARRPFPEEACR